MSRGIVERSCSNSGSGDGGDCEISKSSGSIGIRSGIVLCILVRGRRCRLGSFFRLTHTENGHLCPFLSPFFEVPPRTNMHSTIVVVGVVVVVVV